MKPREITLRLRAWFNREDEASLLLEEMRLHRELRANRMRQAGAAADDAEFAARRRFGNAALYQDQISDLWGWTMWEHFIQDLRLGVRSLAKAPGSRRSRC